MSLGVKGRRSYPLLRLGSYKPMAFWPWIVDYSYSQGVFRSFNLYETTAIPVYNYGMV